MNASNHPDSSAVLKARLRNARGGMTDVTVLDLSAAGCMVDAQGTGLREEDRVLVKMEGLEFMPGTVLWIEDHRAGISYERIMHETILEHLRLRISGAKAA